MYYAKITKSFESLDKKIVKGGIYQYDEKEIGGNFLIKNIKINFEAEVNIKLLNEKSIKMTKKEVEKEVKDRLNERKRQKEDMLKRKTKTETETETEKEKIVWYVLDTEPKKDAEKLKVTEDDSERLNFLEIEKDLKILNDEKISNIDKMPIYIKQFKKIENEGDPFFIKFHGIFFLTKE